MATTTQTPTGRKPAAGLSKEEILRYSRHLIMPEVGMEGQLKLKNAKVLLIGTGGLGAPLGLYLAAAGVGKLGLVDFDVRSEEHTSELQSRLHLVCRLLLEKKKYKPLSGHARHMHYLADSVRTTLRAYSIGASTCAPYGSSITTRTLWETG